jgi:hypothetical protein
MQEDKQVAPPGKEDKKLSPVADGALTALVAIVAVPVVACIAVGEVLDAVGDKVEDGLNVVTDKVNKKLNQKREAFLKTEKGESYKNKVEALGEKVEGLAETVNDFINKTESSETDSPNAKLTKGAGTVAYGLVRGGLAISGALGHGISGFLIRQKNPYAIRMGAEFIKHGFEAAEHNIQEGAKTFKEGLRDRSKK